MSGRDLLIQRKLSSYVGNGHSDWNVFYHNSFLHNDRQVVLDFVSPFQNVSSGYFSVNVWDNGYEGNCWSDYMGLYEDKDGIGDSFYLITSSPATPPELKQYDRYPLMGAFHSYKIDYAIPSRHSLYKR